MSDTVYWSPFLHSAFRVPCLVLVHFVSYICVNWLERWIWLEASLVVSMYSNMRLIYAVPRGIFLHWHPCESVMCEMSRLWLEIRRGGNPKGHFTD
jgi:hypothetical protein